MSYDGEYCNDCGMPVAFYVRTFWSASNELWNRVVGTIDNPRGEGIILCPPDFVTRAKERGIHVCWKAELF